MTFVEFKNLLETSSKLGVDYFFDSFSRLHEVSTNGLKRPPKQCHFILLRDLMFAYYNALNEKFVHDYKLVCQNKILDFIKDINDISTAEFCLLEQFLCQYNSLFGEGGIYNEI